MLSGFLPEQSVAELNKLPSLVQHYFHHQQEHDAGISVIDFIAMHYGESEHTKEENHEDLPLFHSLCTCLLFVHVSDNQLFQPLVFAQAITHADFQDAYFFLSHRAIFQPPKA